MSDPAPQPEGMCRPGLHAAAPRAILFLPPATCPGGRTPVDPSVKGASCDRQQVRAEALRGQPGSEPVRLAVLGDLTPERFFTAPLFYTVAGDARPILRAPPAAA